MGRTLGAVCRVRRTTVDRAWSSRGKQTEICQVGRVGQSDEVGRVGWPGAIAIHNDSQTET